MLKWKIAIVNPPAVNNKYGLLPNPNSIACCKVKNPKCSFWLEFPLESDTTPINPWWFKFASNGNPGTVAGKSVCDKYGWGMLPKVTWGKTDWYKMYLPKEQNPHSMLPIHLQACNACKKSGGPQKLSQCIAHRYKVQTGHNLGGHFPTQPALGPSCLCDVNLGLKSESMHVEGGFTEANKPTSKTSFVTVSRLNLGDVSFCVKNKHLKCYCDDSHIFGPANLPKATGVVMCNLKTPS